MSKVIEVLTQNAIPIHKGSGIYILVIDKEFYLGRAVNMQKRFAEHKRKLRLNEHHSYKLQNKYNQVKQIDGYCICSSEDTTLLEKLEQEYLNKYSPSLNVSLSASNAVLSKEQVMAKQGGSRNHMAKLSLEDAMAVIIFRNARYSISDIANELDLPLPAVTAICSTRENWKDELMVHIPEDYTYMVENREQFGKENRKNFIPKNRLFSDCDLLDIYQLILSRKYTLQEIADRYNTSKTVISSIKKIEVYGKDAVRLLTAQQYEQLKNIPKGQLKL